MCVILKVPICTHLKPMFRYRLTIKFSFCGSDFPYKVIEIMNKFSITRFKSKVYSIYEK